MSIIPCEQDQRLREEIERFAVVLKTEAYQLANLGLDEADFYASPIFRGAIEQVRGEFSATMRGKREFVQHVLNHMQDGGHIADWDPAKPRARHDYIVQLNSGRLAVIDLKGCLDGENTNKFERPPEADEFVTWSLCTNVGGDPRRNVWSGIHTRLTAEMISRKQRVDGLIVWDMICGTPGRTCPKLAVLDSSLRRTNVGPFKTPPPCIYVMPGDIPTVENPSVFARTLDQVELLKAFHDAFGGRDEEVNFVDIELGLRSEKIARRTVIRRSGEVQHSSEMTAIRRV